MEVSVFPDYKVRDLKAGFVEARLHSDAHDLALRERIAELIESLAESTAQPIYISVDPRNEQEMARFSGATISNPQPFAHFLSVMTDELGEAPAGSGAAKSARTEEAPTPAAKPVSAGADDAAR